MMTLSYKVSLWSRILKNRNPFSSQHFIANSRRVPLGIRYVNSDLNCVQASGSSYRSQKL